MTTPEGAALRAFAERLPALLEGRLAVDATTVIRLARGEADRLDDDAEPEDR